MLIIGAAFLVYLNSFGGPFIFDDIPSIRDNAKIRCLWPLTVPLNPPPKGAVQARPMVNLSFAINYALGGLEPWGYHVGNSFLHILASLVLYGVVRRTLITEPLRAKYGPYATKLALAVVTIWSVHPLITVSVAYISSRTELLMGLFYLLTLYCAIRRAESPRGAGWTAASIAACALGMASKEVMVSAPLAVLLYDRIFLSRSFGEALRRRRALYIGLATTWLLLVPLSAGTTFSVRRGGGAPFTVWEYGLTESEVIVHYLRLGFWPSPLVLDYYDWPVARFSLALVACLATVLGLLAATARQLLSGRSTGFLGACFFLILAPTSSFLPLLGEVAAERRMYLPLAAVVALVVIVVWRALEAVPRRWVPTVCAVLAVAIFGSASVRRNEQYGSALAIWSDTASKRPYNPRALTEVGTALVALGRFSEATVYYEQATRVMPGYTMAYSNWGIALAMQGRLAEAVGKLSEAVRRNPASASFHYNLGLALAKQGHVDQAVLEYQLALQIDPSFNKARDGLAGLSQPPRG